MYLAGRAWAAPPRNETRRGGRAAFSLQNLPWKPAAGARGTAELRLSRAARSRRRRPSALSRHGRRGNRRDGGAAAGRRSLGAGENLGSRRPPREAVPVGFHYSRSRF